MTTRLALLLTLATLAIALAGCGLQPVYGDYANGGQNSTIAAAFNDVYIDSIPDRSGQKLRNLLIDRMYKGGRVQRGASTYRLHVAGITESIYGLGIAKDATATRSQIRVTTSFILTRTEDPATPLLQRTITAVSSFNTLASDYTTLVTEEDARDQTIGDLSQQITTMLELYFANPDAFVAIDAKASTGEPTRDLRPTDLYEDNRR